MRFIVNEGAHAIIIISWPKRWAAGEFWSLLYLLTISRDFQGAYMGFSETVHP